MTISRSRSSNASSAAAALLCLALLLALVMAPRAEAAWPGRNGAVVFQAFRFGEEGTETGLGIWSIPPGAPSSRLVKLTRDSGDRDPAVSPDGRLVAFTRIDTLTGRGSIFVIPLLGGYGLHRITDGLHDDSDPAFSHDGKRLLFARAAAGREDRDIYSVGLGGSGLHRITSGPVDDTEPSASPRGAIIAFARSWAPLARPAYHHVFTARVDGARIRDATPLVASNDHATAPDFSPNGRLIAYADQDRGEIFTVRPDGSRLRKLTSFARYPSSGYVEPAFAPNGRSLLATHDVFRSSAQIYAFSTATGELQHYLPIHTHEQTRAPTWAPLPR